MGHDRSLRAPVWKAVFEVATVASVTLFVANRINPERVPWYWAVGIFVCAVIALAMWLHDGGYVTFASSRIDDHRERKAETIRAAAAAWAHQLVGAANSMWTTSSQMTFWDDGWTMGIWLTPPNSSQSQTIGVVNAICRVRHVGHGDYRGSKGTPTGEMGLSLAFPQEFQQLSNSPAIRWPLPEGEFQVDWTGMPGYATRHTFRIGKNEMVA